MKTVQKLPLHLIPVIPVLFIATGCANRGAPVGGPKDITPPIVINTNPADKSVNFVPEKDITITFDEYVVLKDPFQEIIVSPPLKENVNASVNNKSIVVEFPEETVFDSTTYTISFGKSIVDNNEGNLLNNYEFVFSLKGYIDSLNVEGKIVNSFDLKPDKERFFVMLYKNLSDSAPIKEKPKFLTRTAEDGTFSIHNIESGLYRIFALQDGNGNLLFDLPDEKVAFADSVIELSVEKIINDSSVTRNLTELSGAPLIKAEEAKKTNKLIEADSIKQDTIIQPLKYSFRQELRFFKGIAKNQYMTNYLRTRPEMLLFTFNQTLVDSFTIDLLNNSNHENWYLTDFNKTADTLKFWLTDTSLVSQDSLKFKVSYPVYDTAGLIVTKTDTLFLNIRSKETKNPRLKKRKETEEEIVDTIIHVLKKLPLKNSITNSSTFDLNGKIIISSETPLHEVKSDKISVYLIEDTLAFPVKSFSISDISLYGFTVEFDKEEKTSYDILIPDSTVFDIYGSVNDTSIISFNTQSEDFYGILTMHIKNIKYPVILQLLDEKETIIRENFFSSDQSVRYDYLYPKSYILKLIVDSNNNGQWDTGKYIEHLQPEKVLYYQQSINVRSNWEIEMNWEVDY